jgi:hypothetical protein
MHKQPDRVRMVKQITAALIALLKEHGPDAFSIRGPLSITADAAIKELARKLFDHGGLKAMHKAFDAVEDFAFVTFSDLEASRICSCLDHRFDGVGGWWA